MLLFLIDPRPLTSLNEVGKVEQGVTGVMRTARSLGTCIKQHGVSSDVTVHIHLNTTSHSRSSEESFYFIVGRCRLRRDVWFEDYCTMILWAVENKSMSSLKQWPIPSSYNKI